MSAACSLIDSEDFMQGTEKKDMGQLAMTYKSVYVASICVHVNPQQAVRAFLEADAYPGPSLILAYCPCISQGYPMAESIQSAPQLFTRPTRSEGAEQALLDGWSGTRVVPSRTEALSDGG